MEGRNDDQDEFHDSFRYQPPPALPTSSPVQASTSTPFSGTQTDAVAPQDEVAALTAEIASVKAANEALEIATEVTRLKAELHALRQRNAQLQQQSKPFPKLIPNLALHCKCFFFYNKKTKQNKQPIDRPNDGPHWLFIFDFQKL